MYYVYTIQSEKDKTLYKGYTSDYRKRLQEHNDGLSHYTSAKIPWKLIYVEEVEAKSEALIRERKLKRCNQTYLLWLVEQKSNILKKDDALSRSRLRRDGFESHPDRKSPH